MEEYWYAFALAVMSENYYTPEMAFHCLADGKKRKLNVLLTNEDFEDMLELKKDKDMTYYKLGDIYGLESTSIFKRLKKYKEVAV